MNSIHKRLEGGDHRSIGEADLVLEDLHKDTALYDGIAASSVASLYGGILLIGSVFKNHFLRCEYISDRAQIPS